MFDPFFNLPHWLPRFDCGRTGHATNDLPSRLFGIAQVRIGLVERLAFHASIVTDRMAPMFPLVPLSSDEDRGNQRCRRTLAGDVLACQLAEPGE